MMNAAMFESFVHSDIKELPSRIVANFDRIRELDERVQNLQRQVDETTVHRALLVQQRESVAAGGETGTAAAAAAVTGTGTEAAATREEALPQTRDDGDEKTPGEDEAAGASAPSAEPAPSDAAGVRRLTTPGASPLPSPTMQPARQSKRKVEHDIMETERKVEQWTKECVELAEEKVALASEVLMFVNAQTKKIDKNIARYKKIEEKKQAAKRGASGAAGGGQGGRGRRKVDAADPPPMHYVAPTDPNAEKFCLCRKISYGEMIGCDNPKCKIEWFHFACVGLTTETRPTGKWFCPICRKQ